MHLLTILVILSAVTATALIPIHNIDDPASNSITNLTSGNALGPANSIDNSNTNANANWANCCGMLTYDPKKNIGICIIADAHCVELPDTINAVNLGQDCMIWTFTDRRACDECVKKPCGLGDQWTGYKKGPGKGVLTKANSRAYFSRRGKN